ncbi:MAG: class E sortase, partial [Acidimicrobiia bacterium]
PVAKIEIDKIGISQVVVEGVNVADLRKGPGHYPGTALPGQTGTVAIAGHRTTYGAPFADLDQLVKGDEIMLTTVQGRFTYKVNKEPFAVDPDDGDVLGPVIDTTAPGGIAATLTLTTCNPKYSAAQRLIVQASLVLPPGAQPLPSTARPGDVPTMIDGLDGETSSRTPALVWGLIALLVGLAWWYVFHRYPRWYVWFLGAVPFLVVLFFFYTYLEQLLPANY